jgi:hypothetical protein
MTGFLIALAASCTVESDALGSPASTQTLHSPTAIAFPVLNQSLNVWDDWDWTSQDGGHVSDHVINSFSGPGHCGWDTVVFLDFGTPLGSTMPFAADRQRFIRDPYGDLNRYGKQADDLQTDIELPTDAKFSGYTLQDNELWILEATTGSEVYIVNIESVEKWPRMDPTVGCS